MDKKILIIFLIAIVAFSISCVSAADSNEIVMNSSDAVSISEDVSVDDGAFANPVTSEDSQVVGNPSSEGVWVATTGSDDNDGSQASPVASVSKAVDLAQSGSTIHIKEGTYNQGKISLNKTLSFVGEGKVILNSNGANVFACEKDGYNLEFTNLVFTGVSSTAGTSCGLKVGGNGNLKVINCTFTDISAKYGAMQLYTTGVADIINSTIKDVVSGTSNGCIVYISGSGTYNFNNLSIINPKLADSVVAGSPYAFLRNVFYSYGKEATVTLTNSIITGASGPIQAVVESRGKLTIYNTVISNNVVGKTTTSYGKYLLYVGEVTALNMTNCIIENNTFADSSSALIYFNSACKANITYSSIVDNGFSKNVDVKSGITPTVNLDYNWWGTNTYTGDNVNKWVVMSTPETTIDAESGKAIDVSVNFNHYTDASGSIQDLAQSISGINVDFSAVSGTLSKNNVASVDGIATVTYTTTTNDKITAKSGSQSLTIDVVAKQAAADIWVATTGSDDNDGSQASPVATITKAIELAGDGYIIHIADGNYVIDKTLSISKSLTLEGNANTVINGNASRIMEVTADATVVLTNLSFTNGKAAFEGAILNEGKLTISNSNFYSNKATGSSGTIITNKNKLNINNSKFYQNSAARGVVFNQNDAVLVIDNSEFYNNDMTSFSNSYGIVYTTSANATISNTVFRNNVVKWGGAIYATKSSDATIGIVNIINSTFESNSANTGQGGALFVSGGECIVKESTFINNKANPGKYTGGQGGAIYTSLNGNVSVTDSVFKNNQAKLGAVLYLNGGSNSIISYSVLLNNTAEGDYAISNGESASGVATVNYNWWGTNSPKNLVPSTVTLNNWVIMSADPTTVTDAEIGDVKTISVNFNKYSSFGAIKDLSKPLPAIDVEFSAVNGTLTSNLVSTVDGVASVTYTVNGNDQITAKSGSQTLTIEVVAKLPVTDVWVSSTGSDANDGSQDSPVATITKAIELVAEGHTIHVGEGTYIANSLTIAKSFAMIGSGKVIIDGNASKIMTINENTIVNFTNVAFTNALNNYGGVMQNLKGTVNLNNVSFYKNTQKSGSTPTVSSIYNTGVMTIANSNIYENDGYGLIFNSGNLDIINTTISSNNVANGTTYAFLYIDSGAVNVINSTLSDNTARLAGIWLNKGTLNVNNATFENNVVTVGNGGAIHIEYDSSTATIKDSKFIGNKANKDGGAIYNKGKLNIETSIFDANAASNGNTGYHGDDIYNSGILTLHYSALLGKGTNKLIYNEGREPSANAQYNWWGTNSNPSTLVGAGLDYDDEPCDDVDVSNWVVMSVDPVSIENANVGDEKTLTVNFNHYNANGVIKELTKAIPSVAVSFEAVNGTLAGNIISTVDGVASVTYTVNGNDQITVTSGSQTLTIDVSAKQPVTDVWVSASGSDANDGSQANPVATIAKAVELVKPGYTIHVMDGTYTVSDLAINFNVAIIGENEVTFTGDTKTMFTVANGIAFNLTNLNITGINRGTSNYGVIYNKGGSVYLNKINAYSNTANQGAVVYSDKGSVNIVDSEFRANSGTVGVIYANAANVVMNNSKIYDSTFSGNGVIYGSGSSVIDLSNVDISNNKMTGNALIGLAGTELTVSDSYVHNNTLSSGAIFYGASSDNVLNIRYSIFGDNTVNKGFAYCLLGTFKADISDSIIISNEGTTFDALIGTISGTIDNNWWGTNSPKTGKLIPSKWVVLTATSNFTESLKAGEVIGITAGLNTLRDAAGNNYTLGDTDIFDGWNVEINGEKATVKDGKATVLYTLTSGENVIPVKADSETLTLTYNVGSSTTNIVTNDTFFNFFDNAGTLLESITYDTLIFKGEFSDLGVNVVYVPRAITINGDNAVLRNIAFAVLSDNVVLNGLTLISNVSCADNGGALILVAGNNVNITDMNISYIIKESVDAVAINANGVSNLNVVNSNIFFEACPKDDTLTACAINMEGVSNSFIDGNNITAVLPYLFASNYDYTYFMMGVNTVNPIRMRECTNVTFSKNNVNTTANDGSASFPTLQCMFIVGSKDCVIDGNNFSMIDTVIPAGTSNYLYGINIGYNKNLMISNNDFKMSTAGGKDAAGTAYAIQGVECEVSMIGNNITSVSNGPNLGIYFASMSGGTSELYIANNLINVTGLASASGSWALVSGIEVQNGNAKIYNNTIYTYNVGAYNPGNYMYGISYAQYMYGDRSFDVRNNTVYVDGYYAVSFLNANNCNVTDNFLITRDLAGDAAVEIKAGKNNVVENNYPRSSDLIFNITSEEPGKILINVTIDKKATGNMTIKVNGEEYTVTIVDGSASLTLDNLDNGTYFIETAYGGNTFITESSNSTFFNLGLIESSIVLNVSDIKVGQDAIITANITDGATGTVTFFVNGNSYLVFIENGTATLKVSDLTPGDYSVFAQYNGDKQYTISSNSTVFNVAKLSSKVAINVNNIKVGQDATIRLTLPNVNSGVVSVIVNGKTYNVNIVNTKGTLTVSNLANGTYTVIAKFEGNDMYAASEANTTFSVSKIASTTTVSVSDINATQDAVINVAVPGIASGVVSVTVGDAIYSVAVVDGKGSLTVSGLAAGSYDVVAKFAETDMYLASEDNATFSVSKLASTITVAVGDIDATHDAIVNVEVPNVDLGSVTVTIGKTSYNVAIIDGKGTLNVPNLDGATYDVVAKFNGNDKYLASENTTKFTVSKIASNIVVYVKDIDVDGLLVFDAFVSQGATGSVFFRKGLTEVGNHIIDGRATVRWGYMSTAGTYTFEVRYAGDGKFLPFYSTVSANVNKIASSVSVNVNDINVGENAIIYATVSPSGVAGDVKLTIDNKTYTEKISDGVVKFTIPNLTAGKHEISVTYAGNYKYLSSTSSTSINVSRFDSTTHVSVNDINAGENAVINIAVSNGTSGVASVRVGDMSYNVAVVDGKGTLTLSNLIAKSYDVVVKFEGNDVYLPSQDATKFTVSKIVSATNITVSDINVGDDAVIDIAVSNVTSGVISVRVDNTVYNVVIVDGKGTLVVSNLAAGYYTVVAKFAENDMYLASMDTVRFTVSKLASTITVAVGDINVGDDAVIGIAVPEVTSGVASVTVNGKSYNVAVVDGKGTLVVSNLAAGYYTVVAKFAENDMYLASMDTVRFTVSKLASTITVAVGDINVGDDAVIGIAVPEVTSGVASVTVNGKSYNVAVVDGKGSLIVSGLAAGSYDVVAKFAETDMYLASENSAKFTVSKLVISSMDVDVKDIKVGDDAVISVALPEDATGNVIVNVNGKNYTAVVKYGVASVTVSNLANGTYSVSVFYNGDDTYMPMENSTKFTVSKVSDYNMTVDIADIIKGENATITVTTPKDGTGSVVVTINGTDYKGTVTNGTAKVIIPGLDEGTYKVVTFYAGDAKYDSMIVNGTITVNKNTKTILTMDDVVKYFKGAQNLTAKLVDAFGNPIANATVYFTVNGKVYAKTTDKNGTASMGIGLVPNEYKVNAVFNGTKDYDKATANATVTIKNTVFGNDTTLYFCNGTKYVAKFLDSNGKALSNTTVKFNINGVFYTRVTDENGTAGLGIRLDPKSYVITAYNPATGEERANNITVLPRLTAQDLSMKYLDGSTFNATLVDGQGKALAGVNITFNVNGVFYHKTTNANGVASLNIRLMAGEYIITSMYDNCWASNKITISA